VSGVRVVRALQRGEREVSMKGLAVRDLMTEPVMTVTPSTRLLEVRDLMIQGNFRHVPVVEDDELVGLISDRDLGRILGRVSSRLEEMLEDLPASQVMSRTLETAEPDEPLREAGARMLEGKYGCLPVVEGHRVVGILTEADFVRHVVAHEQED
jgi:CBS domain-containing protein